MANLSATTAPIGAELGATVSSLLEAAQPRSPWDIAALLAFTIVTTRLLSKPWDKPDPYHNLWYERPQLKNGGSKAKVQESRNIAQRLDQLEKHVVVFWGSQSGTAQGFAARLERELVSRFGLATMSADLSDYDPATISLISRSKFALFIMATFGEGDPSDNAIEFMDYLKNAPGGSLSKLRYAAFGLGDSNYQHFNRVVDTATSMMNNLGAASMLPVGKADAAQGATEQHFMAWKDALLKHLQEVLGLEERPPTYVPQLEAIEDESLDVIDLYQGTPFHHETKGLVSAALELPIADVRELFKRDATARNCVHMELDISAFPELRYKTGDYLSVWPSNPDSDVERLLSVLGMTSRRHVPILAKPLDPAFKLTVPTPTTRDALFRHYLEICAPVSRDTILDLVQFAPSPASREFLERLASNQAVYASFVGKYHLTLGRLLQHAAAGGRQETMDEQAEAGTWSGLPLAFVIEALSALRPRLYSISSSSIISPRRPSLTSLVVQTPLTGSPHISIPGLASNYLYSQQQYHETKQPAKLRAAIRASNFGPPVFSKPLIMIAAGTGVAPFRAFVLERARLAAMGRPVEKTLLFFGCRNPREDFLYQEELESAVASLPDAELVATFSRAEYEGKPGRGYVQDAVRARGADLGRLIVDQGARVFVCGRAAMGREVCVAIREVLKAYSSDLAEDAACMEWWERWRRSGGYAEDVWG